MLWAKKYKISVSAHFSVPTKKLNNIEVGKRSILTLKCTFLGQNRLNIYNKCIWENTTSMFPRLDTNQNLIEDKNIVKTQMKTEKCLFMLWVSWLLCLTVLLPNYKKISWKVKVKEECCFNIEFISYILRTSNYLITQNQHIFYRSTNQSRGEVEKIILIEFLAECRRIPLSSAFADRINLSRRDVTRIL